MITEFKQHYAYLSNFYIAPFEYENRKWRCVEQAYVAYKTTSEDIRDLIEVLDYSPGELKKFGRQIPLREDWNKVKLPIMRNLVGAKFEQNPILMDTLKATAPQELIEGNWWGDRYWGQCPIGEGKNHLGKILMEIRDGIV